MKKHVLTSLVLALFSAISPSFAAEQIEAIKTHNDFSFIVNTVTSTGGQIYYNRDTVKDLAETTLATLGASRISVTVGSGAGDDLVLNPSVWVQFDSVRLKDASLPGTPVQAEWKTVSIKGESNSLLADGILEGLKSHFEVRDLKGSPSRGFPDSPYHYQLTTLFAR